MVCSGVYVLKKWIELEWLLSLYGGFLNEKEFSEDSRVVCFMYEYSI